MIRSYRVRRIEGFAEGETVAELECFRRQGVKRTRVLGAATTLSDLRWLPSNRLESLKGDRKGQFGIRVNDQWRIYFE